MCVIAGVRTIAAQLCAVGLLCSADVSAATITVNSLADDVFPSATGAIFNSVGSPVVLSAPKCTLRMAIAAANLDSTVANVPIGGANGCALGSGTDEIVFDAALNLTSSAPGTITLADLFMDTSEASFVNNVGLLAITRPLRITGPGSSKLTIDGTLAAASGHRMLVATDGNQDTDAPVDIRGLRFANGRGVDMTAACLFSAESITMVDMIFENCESLGGPTFSGFGGAAGVGNASAGAIRPAVSISDSQFLSNRSRRGTNAARSEAGALFVGSSTRKVGAVTLTNVAFNGNSAERAGAMVVQDATSVTISGSHFVGNAATGSVAGTASNADRTGRYGAFVVSGVSGNVTINNGTRINSNVANEERGGFGVLTVGGTTTIDTVDVTGNYVNRGRIGGFEVLTDSFDATSPYNCQGLSLHPVVIHDVRVMGNSVASNTGGFRVVCSGALSWTNGWVAGNETRGYRLSQTDVVATSNSAGQLGSASDATAAQSTATLTDVTFYANSTNVTGAGGGGSNVFTVGGLGQFTGDSLRFVENSSDTGGIFVLNANGAGRNYLVVNSEISQNWSPRLPGLFVQTDGNYVLRNSTLSANQSNDGGAFYANVNTDTPGGISISIDQSTIARNTSTNDALTINAAANLPHPGVSTPTYFGGGNAAISIRNSILGARTAGSTTVPIAFFDAAHGVTNVNAVNSLLEWTGGSIPANFCTSPGMKCNVGAMLSPLANNGSGYDDGMRTMALQSGSPAIDAGGAVTPGLSTDQRGPGFTRVLGAAVDMGAYESSPGATLGCTLDIDGNGTVDALTDGLLLVRSLFGLTGTAVTSGALGSGATRANWSAIQTYLNANCGMGLAP